VVEVLIQAANKLLLLAASHLPSDIVVFPTVASLQPQSAVGPQLAFAAKAIRSLNQRTIARAMLVLGSVRSERR